MSDRYKLNNYPIDSPTFDFITMGAGVVIIQEGRVLLVKESDNALFSFPGGAIENNESMESTAVRELKEELNLEAKLMPEPYIYSFVRHSAKIESELVLLFHFAAKEVSGVPKLGTDAKFADWRGLGDSFSDCFENVRFAFEHFLSKYGPNHGYKIKPIK